MEFFGHAESWVLVAFILFIALLVYLKVPAMLAKMLDERSAKIAKDLEEAAKLREEAQALLSEYQKKRVEAEKDAANIVAQAKVEAQSYAEEMRRKLGEMLERRTKQAEQKIAQAEATAVKEVRAHTTDAAIAAATAMLSQATARAQGDKLIEESIDAVKTVLN